MDIWDGHIHMGDDELKRDAWVRRLQAGNPAGGILISPAPPAFPYTNCAATPAQRLDRLFSWIAGAPTFQPFFWIDPMEADALDQVALAVARGVAGFKVICHAYFPSDPKALRVFHAIAAARRPILFHSGILWDGQFSSRYNRPAEFEALIEVPGLRFAMAHVAWPWCDELIAVYGKFAHARAKRPDLGVEMFIDTTPGTPPIYRREVLARLFAVGYAVDRNVCFGSDAVADNYDVDSVGQSAYRDLAIFRELGLSDRVIAQVFAGNLKRFVGLAEQ